ncbi:hypothetical protein COV16_06720 [Candidatus Woesearchaeota archaeon CG10_big_fil_rev_8_21_14_0_10_34_8]|nr:MAG: hypothetical protein COV16_06720 [Candidatus Woesearchaeota archaeon CG10_big_fil_rev_8_21_14_0_10_34_8]
MNPLNLLQNFDNTLGALLFLGLIPFLLLYLIKPKPSDRVIPSLMFLVKQMQQTKSNSFFKHFMRDILVLIHVLILILMCIAAMHPFYETNSASTSEYTVLVIDNSASMSTNTGLSSRLSSAISEAKDHLNGKISIILSQNTPYVVLREGDKADALDVINSVQKTDMLSALGSSILAADDLFGENTGKVVVISDFINTDPLSPYVAKESLEAKGHSVEFVNIKENAENVGIVDMKSIDDETIVTVQNYNDKTVNVDVEINNKDYSLEIGPYWQEKITFLHQEGINTIKLKNNDDFSTDNEVLLSVPAKKEVSFLVLTNNEKNYVYPVMKAYSEIWNKEASVEKAEPPVMPVVTHDIIILTDVQEKNIPSSVVNKIKQGVEEGATLIITAQDDIKKLGLDDLLPVELGEVVNRKTEINMENVLTAVTNGITIPSVEKFIQTTAKEHATVFASTNEGVPIMAIGSYGEGTVVYYGIFESNSSFKYDVSYPIFWLQLTDYIIGKDTINTLNYKIGEKLLFDNDIKIKTPSGKELKQDYLEFEETGLYEFMNKIVASNLLNNVESNVGYSDETYEKTLSEEEADDIKTKKPLTKHVVISLIVILFLELMYVKLRGDF